MFLYLIHRAQQTCGWLSTRRSCAAYQVFQRFLKLAASHDQQFHFRHLGDGLNQYFKAFVVGEPTNRQKLEFRFSSPE